MSEGKNWTREDTGEIIAQWTSYGQTFTQRHAPYHWRDSELGRFTICIHPRSRDEHSYGDEPILTIYQAVLWCKDGSMLTPNAEFISGEGGQHAFIAAQKWAERVEKGEEQPGATLRYTHVPLKVGTRVLLLPSQGVGFAIRWGAKLGEQVPSIINCHATITERRAGRADQWHVLVKEGKGAGRTLQDLKGGEDITADFISVEYADERATAHYEKRHYALDSIKRGLDRDQIATIALPNLEDFKAIQNDYRVIKEAREAALAMQPAPKRGRVKRQSKAAE